MTSSCHNEFQMFSDGDTLAIVCEETTYIFTDPSMKECSASHQCDVISFNPIGTPKSLRVPNVSHLDVALSFFASSCVKIPTSEFNFGEKILSKYSARDLIKIIKKKIEDRSQDGKK